MSRGAHLGEFEQTVLFALERLGEPVSGRAVYREIVAATGRETSVAGVHVALNRLHAKGLIDVSLAPGPAGLGRDVRVFAASHEGTEALRAAREYWLRLWSHDPAIPGGRDSP